LETASLQFEHQAMATYFKLVIHHEDEGYAQNAADQVFALIDEMEHRLSRFIPDSDIARINRMKANDQLALDYDTWQVMKSAFHVHQMSHGAFDIGVARQMDIFRAAKQGILNDYEMNQALIKEHERKKQSAFYLDPDQALIICGEPGMQFDLGGIGKGYVLDVAKLHLKDMEIYEFSLSAGDSTVLVGNQTSQPSPWRFPISAKFEQRMVSLDDISISASGTYYQGKHIFDPRTGQNDFEAPYDMTWVAAKSAAISDAFSTATFMLAQDEIENCVSNSEDILWVAYATAGNLHFVSKNDTKTSI
jgi:thiamine biosynthesis lipoprotein